MPDDKLFDEPDDGRQPIKVTDRRLFDRAGNPRPEAEAGPAPPPGEASGAKGEPVAEMPGAQAPTPETRPAEQPLQRDARPGDEAGSDPEETAGDGAERIVPPQPRLSDLPRDFAAFVEGMYVEAMIYLGALADPRSGESMEDVELAKYKIDLLGMLQEKTAGNLSAAEQRQLEEALYQLRMIYLQKTKTARL